MRSSAIEPESPDLVCQFDNVDSDTSVRWKKQQDAVLELSEHGIVLIVEETACRQAKVYLQRESAALKEAIDDLERPGSSIHLILQPTPPSVTFRGEGHGDLQIDFMHHVNTDLLVTFHCDRQVSHMFLSSQSVKYKYKFLRATTSNIPAVSSGIIEEVS